MIARNHIAPGKPRFVHEARAIPTAIGRVMRADRAVVRGELTRPMNLLRAEGLKSALAGLEARAPEARP
ncbi:MAG: hypothetical protein WDA25_05265 [Paracoccaceae bacterium]